MQYAVTTVRGNDAASDGELRLRRTDRTGVIPVIKAIVIEIHQQVKNYVQPKVGVTIN